MTINPHDNFVRDMYWLLQAIKKEQMTSAHAIEFEIGTGEGAPNISTQRNMLQCLKNWNAIFIQPDFAADSINPPTLFTIKFINNRFEHIYKLFSNGLKTGVDSEKIYDLANMIFSLVARFRFSNADEFKKEFEAWLFMNGKYLGTEKIEFKSGRPAEPKIKLPAGTAWPDIEIRFKNNFDIDIFVGSKNIKSTDHIELGCFKSGTKKRMPDKQYSRQIATTVPKVSIPRRNSVQTRRRIWNRKVRANLRAKSAILER